MSTVLFLSIGLAAIMLSLGLALSLDDFKRVLVYPRAVIVALSCQTLVLPWVAFFIALQAELTPPMAVGLMLLAATPGGVTANLYSHLSRGDVALNISLTAINSVLALVTLPLILSLSLNYFMAADQVIPPPVSKVIQVILIVIIPVAIGMVLRHFFERAARRLEKPMKLISGAFLLAMVALVMVREWNTLLEYLPILGATVLAFNLASLGLGYGAGRLARLEKRQAIAMGMEIGIHNATLAIAIAFNPQILGNPSIAIPASLYGLIMLLTAGLFGYLVNLGSRPAD